MTPTFPCPIRFTFGQVLDFAALPPNSIALDGAVQGPQMDPATRRYSFDHHAGCLRMVTLATCQQVSVALQLGLVVDPQTVILINDLDADTVLSVWLLLNPSWENEPRAGELVRRVGLTDAHGPLFPPHPLHRELAPPYGSTEPQTLEMLAGFLDKVDRYVKTGENPLVPREDVVLARGFAWKPTSGWEPVEKVVGFEQLYARGFLAAALYTDAAHGTRSYTIGKRSDLVPLKLGPGARIRPPTSDADYLADTILGKLALRERAKYPLQSHEANWGGGSSIGGSPRNPDGSSSSLFPMDVLAVLQEVTSTAPSPPTGGGTMGAVLVTS